MHSRRHGGRAWHIRPSLTNSGVTLASPAGESRSTSSWDLRAKATARRSLKLLQGRHLSPEWSLGMRRDGKMEICVVSRSHGGFKSRMRYQPFRKLFTRKAFRERRFLAAHDSHFIRTRVVSDVEGHTFTSRTLIERRKLEGHTSAWLAGVRLPRAVTFRAPSRPLRIAT
jgi:hypothetical protein